MEINRDVMFNFFKDMVEFIFASLIYLACNLAMRFLHVPIEHVILIVVILIYVKDGKDAS